MTRHVPRSCPSCRSSLPPPLSQLSPHTRGGGAPHYPDFLSSVRLCRRATGRGRRDGPLNLLFDSTGIKFLGDREWQARKHGVKRRCRWRKVHLAKHNLSVWHPAVA